MQTWFNMLSKKKPQVCSWMPSGNSEFSIVFYQGVHWRSEDLKIWFWKLLVGESTFRNIFAVRIFLKNFFDPRFSLVFSWLQVITHKLVRHEKLQSSFSYCLNLPISSADLWAVMGNKDEYDYPLLRLIYCEWLTYDLYFSNAMRGIQLKQLNICREKYFTDFIINDR